MSEENVRRLYGDMLDLPHPISKRHPRLSKEQHAAQYAPFAALTGFGGAITKTAGIHQEQMETSLGIEDGWIDEFAELP